MPSCQPFEHQCKGIPKADQKSLLSMVQRLATKELKCHGGISPDDDQMNQMECKPYTVATAKSLIVSFVRGISKEDMRKYQEVRKKPKVRKD